MVKIQEQQSDEEEEFNFAPEHEKEEFKVNFYKFIIYYLLILI